MSPFLCPDSLLAVSVWVASAGVGLQGSALLLESLGCWEKLLLWILPSASACSLFPGCGNRWSSSHNNQVSPRCPQHLDPLSSTSSTFLIPPVFGICKKKKQPQHQTGPSLFPPLVPPRAKPQIQINKGRNSMGRRSEGHLVSLEPPAGPQPPSAPNFVTN